MEMATALTAGLRDWIDFSVIIGILLLNATVGWYQEKQTSNVVASLKGDSHESLSDPQWARTRDPSTGPRAGRYCMYRPIRPRIKHADSK